MTRDSKLWWLLMAGSILGVFSAHFDLLQVCCDLSDKSKALIELGCLVSASVSGVMRMSPLPISPEGRTDAIRKDVKKALRQL